MDEDFWSELFLEAFVDPGAPAADFDVVEESLEEVLDAFAESESELILSSIVAV